VLGLYYLTHIEVYTGAKSDSARHKFQLLQIMLPVRKSRSMASVFFSGDARPSGALLCVARSLFSSRSRFYFDFDL
jgi:hypothetical protein